MKKFVATLSVLSALSMSVVPAMAHGDANHGFDGKQITVNFTNQVNNIYLSDIQGHWAQKYIQDLVNKGVLSGEGDHHFKPEGSVSRAEWATMVDKYFNLTSTATTQDFQDVPTTAWDYQYVEAIKNYFDAYSLPNGGMAFRPNTPATRQDVTVTLVKVLNKLNPSIQPMDETSADALLQQTFKDWNSISPVLRPYVAAAVQNNMIHGDNKGNFNPVKPLTRAEAATMLDLLLANGIVVPGDGSTTGTTTTGTTTTGTTTTGTGTVSTNPSNPVTGTTTDSGSGTTSTTGTTTTDSGSGTTSTTGTTTSGN